MPVCARYPGGIIRTGNGATSMLIILWKQFDWNDIRRLFSNAPNWGSGHARCPYNIYSRPGAIGGFIYMYYSATLRHAMLVKKVENNLVEWLATGAGYTSQGGIWSLILGLYNNNILKLLIMMLYIAGHHTFESQALWPITSLSSLWLSHKLLKRTLLPPSVHII